MTESNTNKETPFPRTRVKKGSNRVLYFFIFTIIALTSGFYFYEKNSDYLQQFLTPPEAGDKTTQNGSSADTSGEPVATGQPPSSGQSATDGTSTSGSGTETSSAKDSAQSSATLGDEATNADNETEPTEESDYETLITRLNSFYSHLDSQQYMQDFKLSEPSKEHFSKLIQKLIDNPPVVTRETDDLFTLLKNTAHFFRVLGKNNILILKGILDREKDSFETVLQTFYNLTDKPQYLKDAYSISLDSDALYDYAGFFLHTMGGRLYLFRRDSNSRMAVSYYAILIIDRANTSGNSRHGIDIRPAVDALIEEIENGGNNLKLREVYLDRLYDLKEKYN